MQVLAIFVICAIDFTGSNFTLTKRAMLESLASIMTGKNRIIYFKKQSRLFSHWKPTDENFSHPSGCKES